MAINQYTPYLDWIATQQQHMVLLTEQWSRINSGSYNLAGIKKFRDALKDNFSWLEGEMKLVPLKPLLEIDAKGEETHIDMAEALVITKRPHAKIQVLLAGHMDTVYGVDHHFQEPKYLEENILNGPGVADLKGGLVVMLKALEALEKSPWAENVGWQVILNPDEEIGTIASDPLYREAAKGKHLGMIYEPALADGSLAGARKGSDNYTIVVRGRAAHAGRNPEDGRNAIVALAEITQKIFALNGKRDGLTLNPGHIAGGGATNVVPDLAILRLNLRPARDEDQAWVEREIRAICEEVNTRDGFSVKVYGSYTRHPKPMSPQNKAIFDMVLACGKELGLDIAVKPSGGCCDGNNLWRYGLPNVDTLGVRGAHIHSDKEIVYLDSLTERAQLSALLLMKLASGELGIGW